MQHTALAHALRERQHALGQVPAALIEALSDEEIIDASITCSCCGEKQVTPAQLHLAIALATDAESFFMRCDHLGKAPTSSHHAGKAPTMDRTTHLLPAGDYLIIDPCYVYKGTRWQTLIEVMYAWTVHGVCTDPATGLRFAHSGTATGDGVYADQDGHRYGVDSGTLACLPLTMIDAATLALLPTQDHSTAGVCSGRLVTFAVPCACTPCDARGVIRFGHIAIETGPTWEELRGMEDDEDDEDDED